MLGSYAPGKPDIGSAVHGGTASTGIDVTWGLVLLLVLVAIAVVIGASLLLKRRA